MTADGTGSPTDPPARNDGWLHDESLESGRSEDADAADVRRRSAIDRSESSLISRDYRPLTEGPTLIDSWALGPPPAGRGTGAEWEVSEDWVTLQRTMLSAPHLAALDRAPTYLIVCGRARTAGPDAALEIELANEHLDGKPYEATLSITATEETVFNSPTVEFTPDRGVYRGLEARHFPEYVLRARATDGGAAVNACTTVQLWSG